MEYTGLTTILASAGVVISALKSAAVAVDHSFRVFKTQGSGAFDPIEVTEGLTNALGTIPLVTSAELNPGDRFRVEIASQGASTTVTVEDLSLMLE